MNDLVEVTEIRTYKVIDRHTGKQVGKDYSCRRKAGTRVDKLDNEYGGYRYKVETYINGVKFLGYPYFVIEIT